MSIFRHKGGAGNGDGLRPDEFPVLARLAARDQERLDEIRKEIREKGTEWAAAEIARLRFKEQNR